MKKSVVLLILSVFISFSSIVAQNNTNGPKLRFDTDGYDYGKIDIEKIPEAKLDIKFWNDGPMPLIISNVRGCCGSRITDWTKEPILPGKSGTIKIEFEIASKIHTISRTVTVISNSINSPDIFKIKGEVVEVDNSVIKKR